MLRQKKEFVPPPEAPIFEPTWEEFCDPLAYIDQIRHIGEKYGVVKIKPPPSWQPPFAVDVENFKFTPRIQKLNELEALSRVKLNFIDQLTKFWRLQGISLKLPMLDGKFVDLYTLQKIVLREGGFLEACKKEAWIRISQLMGYSQGRGCELFLSHHYEKIVHPYDLFLSGASLNAKVKEEEERLKGGIAPNALAAGGVQGEEPSIKIEQQSIFLPMKTGKLKKMRRMASNQPCYQREEIQPAKVQVSSSPTKITIKSPAAGDGEEGVKQESLFVSKADQYFCEVCDGGDDDSLMLLCDGCDNAYHTYCLVPPLERVPPGDWMCPNCIAKECCRPMEAYGFEQSRVEYTLESFGAMADQFKANHFGVSPHMVSYSACEKEFWRLVECLEEDVSVEYGADIHSGEQGSGFPTDRTKDQFLGYEEYIASGWNLNNLPVLDLSVLRHVSGDISGMMIPWCYVGMCFSSFSWHIEDHWSYSVNYMHWGEPKTWYGVPGSHAQLLEQCMMKEVPELFRDSPDLLHQLTTIINPNILMDYGVQVFRTDQCPGEFIITFPRSYHAGFNQGYNFAEAVNFCPPDWVRLGRECIEDYRRLKRQCVFSHDQLLCEMADKSRTLNLKMAAVVHDDLLEVVAKEAALRECAAKMGVTSMERFYFETHDDDDDRQCEACKTTCYLSGLVCSQHPERLICLQHDLMSEFKCGCQPSDHVLRFRFTMEELYSLVESLRVRSLSLDVWKAKVVEVLHPSANQQKPDVSHLKDLVAVVAEENLPRDDLLQKIKDKITNAESCMESSRELMNKKVNSRLHKALETFLHSNSMTILQQHQQQHQQQQQPQQHFYHSRLNIAELRLFCDRAKDLPCTFKEADLIQDLLENVLVLQREVSSILSSDSMPSTGRIQELVDWSASLDVEFPELMKLHQLLVQSKWLAEYNVVFSHHEHNSTEMRLTIATLKKLCGGMLANFQVSLHPLYLSASNRVRSLLNCSESVERKAEQCLKEKPTTNSIEMLIEEANALNCMDLPNVVKVRELLSRAKQWQELATMQMGRGHGLHLDELDYLIELGTSVPVRFESLDSVQTRLKLAVQWKQKVFFTFFHGSRKSILQPWFEEVGISLDCNFPRKKEVVFSKDGTFSCPISPITLASLQSVVKATVEKLISSRNTDTKKLLENGKATSSSSTCNCGRSFTDHVRCCVLCTIIYQADCSVLQNNSTNQNRQQKQKQSTSTLEQTTSKPMQFGESGNKIGFMNTTPFGVGFPTSSTPLVGFPAVNQGLFSMTTLAGTSFQSAKVLPGPNQSSFSVFGMANSGTANIFSPNGNQFSSVGPLIVNNHHQQMFSLNNSTTNLFQWTTNEIVPCLHKPITSTSFIGTAADQIPSSNNSDNSNPAMGHLCPTCKGSICRPTHEELKSLVSGWYNMNGICMPEGRALIYLDNLVNEWQQKARKLISSRELVVATGLLDLPSIESKDDQLMSTLPIPESIFQLSSDAILRPRLMTLDVSVGLQGQMSDLLVEMLALNIETQECRLIRSLLYACYEKIVLTEAMKKEEEARRQAKLEEERQKKLEEAERQRKREEEEARKRKLEEDEYKRRMEEENRKRKMAEEEQRKREKIQQQILLQQQKQQQLILQQQQAEKEMMEKKRKLSQIQSPEEHSKERAPKKSDTFDRRRPEVKTLDDKKKSSRKHLNSDIGSDASDDEVTVRRTKASVKTPAKMNTPKSSEKHSRHHEKSTPQSNLSILKNFLTNDHSEDSMDDQISIQAWKSLGSGKKTSSCGAKKVGGQKFNKSDVKKKSMLSGDIYTDDDDDDDDDDDSYSDVQLDDEKKKQLNKKTKKTTAKKHKTKKKKKDDDPLEEEEDHVEEDATANSVWESCNSKTCLKPIGAKVDWVQCDKCEEWYHLLCVQLSKLPDEDEDYICQACTPKMKCHEIKQHKDCSDSIKKHEKSKVKSKNVNSIPEDKLKPTQKASTQEVKNRLNSFSHAITETPSPLLKKKKKIVPSSFKTQGQNSSLVTTLSRTSDKNLRKGHPKHYKNDFSEEFISDDDSEELNNSQKKLKSKSNKKDRKWKKLSSSSSSSSSSSFSSHCPPSSSQTKMPCATPMKQQRNVNKSRDDDDDDDGHVNDSDKESDDSESSDSNRQRNDFDSYLYTPWLNKS